MVSTRVGVTFDVVLDPGWNWDIPTSNSSVVKVLNVERQASGRLDADLLAVRVGRATVSSVGAVLCPPGQACPALARLWAVEITVGAAASRTITVTQADSGHRYQLRKGDRLKVRLSGSSVYTWTEPATSDKAVLRRTGGSSGPTASATFLATAEGKVDITAIDNPNCYPQCLAPSRLLG